MKDLFNTYIPEGFSTVNSYLMVKNPQELIDFLKDCFFAEELDRTLGDEDNFIRNCVLKIGNTCFMISQAGGEFENMRTSFYIYVNDVDLMHQRALEMGAKEVFPPADMDYKDRQSGIIDPSGNYWWISKRLEQKGYHE